MGKQIKVLQKGKITIPAHIRKKVGIHEGDYVTLEIMDNKIFISPANTVPNPAELLSGLAKGVKVSEPLKQELSKASAAGVAEKLLRTK